jgi:hypothetical protein
MKITGVNMVTKKKSPCRRVAEALHRLLFGLLRRSFRVLHLGPVAGAAWGLQ